MTSHSLAGFLFGGVIASPHTAAFAIYHESM
jgi:hypothetical protein